MARRRKGRPVSGWLILDKPAELGSTQAVARVKRLFDSAKAGHAGTLDPLASGMLPVALGEATKTVPYVMDGTKTYRFTVAWGEERGTDDLEGEVTARSDDRPDEAAIRSALDRFVGSIEQVPPAFSAIKIDGARAYDLARGGERPEIPARTVEIHRLELLDRPDADHAVFEVDCGKGTYVRSLARDLGRALGCFGHVSALRRTRVEPFSAEDMVPMETLETTAGDQTDGYDALDGLLIDTVAALDCLPHVSVGDDAAARIRLGNAVILRGRDAPINADEACATARGRLVAIGVIDRGTFKPKRVFRAGA